MPDRRQYKSLRAAAGYAAAGLIAFLLFLSATFPYSDALRTVLEPLGLSFSASDQTFALPLGAELSNVKIVDSSSPAARPLLESPSVKVAPALGSMLMLHPAVKISADIYDGHVTCRTYRTGDATAVSFDARAVNLAVARLDNVLGAALGGALSGSGDLKISPDSIAANSGKVELRVKNASVRIALGLPPISLGDLVGSFSLNSGVLQVERLKSSGGDVAIAGGGSVHLQPDIRDSQLSLQLTLIPTPIARQRLGVLLNLLPHPPGPQPYNLGGTLSAPTLT